MQRLKAIPLVASLAILAYAAAQSGGPAKKPTKLRDKIEFNRDIRPILSNKCLNCHGNDPKAVMAGLRLDQRAGATAKLLSGSVAIVPGHPEKSEMMARIQSKDKDMLMPPTGSNKTLSAEDKLLLAQWIAEGAEYKPHWAFVRPTRPALPTVRKAGWAVNEIDRFIQATLEKKGLAPSPEASRETLIRRVSLDLTGLPPTPAEVDAFLKDPSPKAYETVVDRLLASPRYAERMAMDWMDYARYADSNGYQADFERFQWRWRDWVLNAFNRNMPYDKFTVEQLAGDLLPNPTLDQKIATGFNRNHRINTEGGVIAEEWRVETVIDRVETTSTVWLGLTSGCARCHDHKYDPLSQKEFFSLYAYFNNVPESGTGEERPVNHPPFIRAPKPDQEKRLGELKYEVQDLDALLVRQAQANIAKSSTWKMSGPEPLASLNDGVQARYQLTENPQAILGKAAAPKPGGPVKFLAGRSTGAVETSSDAYLDLGEVGDFEADQSFSLALWVNPKDGNGSPLARMDSGANFHGWDIFLQGNRVAVHLIDEWPSKALKVIAKGMAPNAKWTHVAVSYDGSKKPDGLKIYLDGKLQEFEVEANSLKGSIRTKVSTKIGRRTTSSGFSGLVDDVVLYTRALGQPEIANLANVHPAKSILALAPSARTPEQQAALARLWSQDNDPVYRGTEARRNAAAAELSKIDSEIPGVMVMEEMPKPRPAFVLVRGAYDKPGEKVEARVPAALPPLPKGAPNNRLGLAKWIVDPANPLTSRVTVNRLWERFFGTGIVETIEDFGTRAEFPSHPELLDWLSVQFVDDNWDLKKTIKRIVMSATYRQDSKVTAQHLRLDPANRLLARGPRFRLPAEVIRDQALYAAGILTEKVGGPSVRPYQPDGVWDELNVYGNLRNYKPDAGANRYRRSLYTIWKRTAAPPNMTLFDVSARETCRVRRPRTNTPLQALTLLNDVTYVEAARAFAQRAMKEVEDPKRLDFLFRTMLSRSPTAEEAQILGKRLVQYRAKFRKEPESTKTLLAAGDLPRDPALDPVELASYTLIASTLFNLDEAVTKE